MDEQVFGGLDARMKKRFYETLHEKLIGPSLCFKKLRSINFHLFSVHFSFPVRQGVTPIITLITCNEHHMQVSSNTFCLSLGLGFLLNMQVTYKFGRLHIPVVFLKFTLRDAFVIPIPIR